MGENKKGQAHVLKKMEYNRACWKTAHGHCIEGNITGHGVWTNRRERGRPRFFVGVGRLAGGEARKRNNETKEGK